MTPSLDTMLQVGRTFGVRDGMRRLHFEVQRGTGLMSRKMGSVRGWDFWKFELIAPGAHMNEMLHARQKERCQFFFSDARMLEGSLRPIIGNDGKESAIYEAEKILRGDLPYFGKLSFSCGFPPRWFQNPATGQRVSPQQDWTQMRFASPQYGDLKFILEPSRFLFVYPLARAYAVIGDERFAEGFWKALEDWAHHSPPMSGPLWICGQECSLRILAWSFAFNAFLNAPSTTPARTALLFSLIAAHAWRTSQTLGYARSQRSNHLITEAVGLWSAGVLYPELKHAQVWQSLGAQLLCAAVRDQISPEGISQQHSFNYQRMVLHLLLWTLRLAEIHRSPLPAEIRQRTEAACAFLGRWVDPVSGSAPNYGSDDGSLILPLAPSSYRDFRPLLQLGAGVLQRPGLSSGPWDEASVWFGLKPQCERDAVSARPVEVASEPGYFRLGDKKNWAFIRAGRYDRRPFQADQLHVDLWCDGLNIGRDPGTYLYNGAEPWNNGLARTSVHNTVTVDHRDQMRRGGRFLWLEWAQASGRAFCSQDGREPDCFQGLHEGYKKYGVTHRRAVHWLAGAGWVILDDMEGAGEHNMRLHWLTGDWPFERMDSEITLRAGNSRIRWNIFSSAPGHSAMIRAGEQIAGMGEKSPANPIREMELLGWEAPTYGELQPAISLVYQAQACLPVRFVTVILTDEKFRVEMQDGEIVISANASSANEPQKSEIYRTTCTPSIPRSEKREVNAGSGSVA